MPGERSGEDEWVKEFKKANGPSSRSVPRDSKPAGKDHGRRRNVRFEIDDAAASLRTGGLLSVLGLGKSDKGCRTVDLSAGGACLLVTERYAPKTKIRVKIRMEKYDDLIDAQAEVRWCHHNPKVPDVFTIGVQFLSVDAAMARKIALMQEWFTSPQYQAILAARARKKGDEIELV